MATADVEQVTPAAAEHVEMTPPKTVEPEETVAVVTESAPAPVTETEAPGRCD